eukprot:m.264136 g.264136  ORF g.264136 m.264136 type:complete len:89 (+) comp19247_c6_seq9:3873-4139(+)
MFSPCSTKASSESVEVVLDGIPGTLSDAPEPLDDPGADRCNPSCGDGSGRPCTLLLAPAPSSLPCLAPMVTAQEHNASCHQQQPARFA